MSVVCPTITAYTANEYTKQLQNISFAKRIHIDFMDGVFAPTKSPPLHDAYWPKGIQADLHIMFRKPMTLLHDVLKLHPHLVVVHAEAEHVSSFVHELHEHRIAVGIALLQKTSTDVLSHFIHVVDHVLIFSGDLGHHGGTADLDLLHKVHMVRAMHPTIEIGWDGGINSSNILQLAQAGVNVFNVGGSIQNAQNAQSAYDSLTELLQ